MAIFRNLREQVRAAAAKRKIELQEVAAQMGVTPNTLTRLISTGTADRAARLEELAKILRISPWEFDEYVVVRAADLSHDFPAVLELLRTLGPAIGKRRDALLSKVEDLL